MTATKRSIFMIQQASPKSLPPMNMKLQRLWNPNSQSAKASLSDFGNGPPFYICNKFRSREYRRSARISELDARKAQQAKSRNEGNGSINSGCTKGQGTRKSSNQKLVRKRKTRPVHDLVDNDVESQVQKAGGGGDLHSNAVDMSSVIAMPEGKMLGLLLDRLKRRDSYKIFAEPVDGTEVEGYYDVIKHPMDFSKINQKLNEGSYKALGEFEHDISLMFNNAMQFNASDTIYYKQAYAMKELANKLFQTLKNDPENFEAACSLRGLGPGRRNKAIAESLNSKPCNKTTGSRGERGSGNFELQPRQSYILHTTENELSVAQVYNSSKKFEPVKQNKIGYAKSLMRFANNLGTTAQMVAQRKLGSGITETSKLQAATFNCHLQAPNSFLPSDASARDNITTAPSLSFPGNSAGCQRTSGKELDNHSALNGEKAPTVDSIDIYDVLRVGIAQTSTTMKALDEMHGKMLQSPKNTFLGAGSAQKSITVAPSVKLIGNSASRELDIWNGNLSGQKTSVLDTIQKCDPISGVIAVGSSTNENLGKVKGKMVQTMTAGFDMDIASKKPISSSGYEEICFPAEWDTDGNPNRFSFLKLMLDSNNSLDQTTGVVSSGSKVPDNVPAGYSCPSSSWQWPAQTIPGVSNRSQTTGFMPEVDSHNLGGVHQLQAIEVREGPSSQSSLEHGGQVDWLKLNNNIEEGSSSTQPFGSFQGLDLNYLGGLHHIQPTADKSGPSRVDSMLPGGEVPNWLKPTELGLTSTPFGSFQGLGSNYLGGVHQIQPIADKAGPSHGGSMLPGGHVPNWLKPTVLGLSSTQPISSFQGLDSNYLGVVHQIQPTADNAGPVHGGSMLLGGQVPDWLKPTELGSSITQPFNSFPGLGSNYLGGVHQIQSTADKAGPSHGGNILPRGQVPDWLKPTTLGSDAAGTSHGRCINGGQFSNWFKPTELGSDAAGTQYGSSTINGQFSNWFNPTELGSDVAAGNHGSSTSNWFRPRELEPQYITEDWLQQQCGSLTAADLSSQAEPWQQQQHHHHHHWASTPDGSMIKPPSSNVYDKGTTSGQGQLTIGAPTENHRNQSLPDSGFPRLAYHP